ncbi:MAG: alanine--tRNA ligase [Patescibacteria group bacterium]
MTSDKLRQKFLSFFEKNGHKIVPSSSLLPTDPSVLFTTAGMQQFKPYYLGEKSPWGPNVASVQKCIRTSDIEEVGDERHLTFFEMLGNFSFGGYFKEKAIKLAYEFIVKELGLEIDFVTVFKGDENVSEDKESEKIWKDIDPKIKIKKEGKDNFWGPTGEEGPCGPTTEIYVNGVEIWNIVFNEFFCDKNKKLEKLETPGVDTGMGLERLAMVVQNVPTVFETDLFEPIINLIPKEIDEKKKRIFADHARAIAFLITDGVRPLNKDQGYILRRLVRRALAEEFFSKKVFFEELLSEVVREYKNFYTELESQIIIDEFVKEKEKFSETLEKGVNELMKIKKMDLKQAFLFYQSYGLPYDVIKNFAPNLNQKKFEEELKKHQELSRTASAGMFKGGLADDKPETIKLHTAHHLLLAALQQVFGKQVKQRGSNINSERLRIDFSMDRKMTDEEKKKIEDIVNEKIKEGLDVVKKEMPIEEANKIGAESEFGVKYGNTVSVYFIQDKNGNIFSKEFCGGPHVKNTLELGNFKIIKEEAVSTGVRRIKAILE